MIFNIEHQANWEFIKNRKQELIKKNNRIENAKRIAHSYKEGDKVMLKIGTENKYEQPYSGPHLIEKVNTNGMVRLQMGAVTDTVNIRSLEPYRERKRNSSLGEECNMHRPKSKRRG